LSRSRPIAPTPPRRNSFKQVRILVLLLILLFVAVTQCQNQRRVRSWQHPLYVDIYPIAADDSTATQRYIDELGPARFVAIDRFFAREAARYRIGIGDPVKTRLQAQLHSMPPQRGPDDGVFATVVWSLKVRYWAWQQTHGAAVPADIRMFVLYHDPALRSSVPHSLGLEKGLLGIVYAFATRTMDGGNQMVIAHELMHTVGATDKYDARNDAPLFPQGYAEPNRVPLFPQPLAELMAGRRALDAAHGEQAQSLDEVLIGPASAAEINWHH
jgi:hypothetical protein